MVSSHTVSGIAAYPPADARQKKEEPMTFAEYSQRCERELDRTDHAAVVRLVEAIEAAYRSGTTVFIAGNGGSGANASHLCEDLGKGTLHDFERQKRLRVISLTDNTPYILAWGNDCGYDRVFVEQLKNLAQPGDLFIAISGSGNSPNIIEAVRYANEAGLRTFGITGYDGGKLLELAHDSLHVACDDMGIVEAVHGVVFHYLPEELKRRFAS